MKNLKLTFTMTTAALVVALLISGCTKDADNSGDTAKPADSTSTTTTTTTTSASPSAANTADAGSAKTVTDLKPTVHLSIGTEGDTLAYNKKELSAKAGDVIELTLTNNGKTSGLPHNWVLAKPGTQTKVADAGTQAGEAAGWVQESDDVLAHTTLTQEGKTSSVVFKAPPAGDYPYLCTYPGHALTMNGTLHIK